MTNKTVTMKLWTLKPYAFLTMNIAYDCDSWLWELFSFDYEHCIWLWFINCEDLLPMTMDIRFLFMPMTL